MTALDRPRPVRPGEELDLAGRAPGAVAVVVRFVSEPPG